MLYAIKVLLYFSFASVVWIIVAILNEIYVARRLGWLLAIGVKQVIEIFDFSHPHFIYYYKKVI